MSGLFQQEYEKKRFQGPLKIARNLFKNVTSENPNDWWYDMIQMKKKEFVLILYLFAPFDMYYEFQNNFDAYSEFRKSLGIILISSMLRKFVYSIMKYFGFILVNM